MKLPAAAYSAEVATSATKAGSYGVFGEGEYMCGEAHTRVRPCRSTIKQSCADRLLPTCV
jgi:hypothetical protein